MLSMKHNLQTAEDGECGLQENFQCLHSMQAILTMTIAMAWERMYEFSNMTDQKV